MGAINLLYWRAGRSGAALARVFRNAPFTVFGGISPVGLSEICALEALDAPSSKNARVTLKIHFVPPFKAVAGRLRQHLGRAAAGEPLTVSERVRSESSPPVLWM